MGPLKHDTGRENKACHITQNAQNALNMSTCQGATTEPIHEWSRKRKTEKKNENKQTKILSNYDPHLGLAMPNHGILLHGKNNDILHLLGATGRKQLYWEACTV